MKRGDCSPLPNRATSLLRRCIMGFGGCYLGSDCRYKAHRNSASCRLALHGRDGGATLSLASFQSDPTLMIVGIGSDLCNIERIERSLDRWGDRFLNRVFTETERRKAASRPHTRAGTLAKRFAAKEAFSKA